ncbi:hypothetical protein PG994_001195 [Apiospora phragmitis]|uniref:Uncharacterized protein n=1 Tax=Apiospora phragmitis TaxID=2905665 RepID=A0ABR1WSU4_9PEZI
MGYYETVDVSRSGQPGFVRAHSYHHHHHRPNHREHKHKCFDDCCGVPLSEYNRLLAQVQSYQAKNEKLKADKEKLKSSFADNDQLKDDNERLEWDKYYLSQNVSAEIGKNDAFKQRIKALEKDVIDRGHELHEKKADVRGLKRDVGILNTKLDVCKDHYNRATQVIKSRDRGIQNRDEIIREQNNTIQQLQRLLHEFRG